MDSKEKSIELLFSGIQLSDFPSVKLKADQFLSEFLSLEGQGLINDIMFNQRSIHSLKSNVNGFAPPLSPTNKKSPKKRTQAEMLNTNNSKNSCLNELTNDKDRIGDATASGSHSNSDNFKSSSNNSSSARDLLDDSQDYSSIDTISKASNKINEGSEELSTCRRRSNFDSIPLFYFHGQKPSAYIRITSSTADGIDQTSSSTLSSSSSITSNAPPSNTNSSSSATSANNKSSDQLLARLSEIEAFFKPFKDGIPIDKFVHVTKRLCGLPSYFNLPLCSRILELFGSSSNIGATLPRQHTHKIPTISSSKITIKIFLQFWQLEMEPYNRLERFFRLVKQPNADCIFKDDFMPYLQELLRFHPGLDFLENHEEFQRKYALTVITRIFYKVNISRSGKISLKELMKSNLLQEFMHVDEEPDINRVTEYFSYEHFYVLYCRFFELDSDRDSFLTRENLMKYGDHALSEAIVDRVFQVGSRAFTDGHEGGMDKAGGMCFSDFVYFMISEEDKSNEQALKYWFNCCDLDGDRTLTPPEMRHFYKIQLHRLISLGQESILFQDVMCQMIDMISPIDANSVVMKDLLKPDKIRISGVLFDVLFNLHKFLRFEQRDPFQEKLRREDGFHCDWDRFAHHEYHRLSYEEEHGNNGGSNSNQSTSYSSGGGYSPTDQLNAFDDDDDMFSEDDLDSDTAVHPSGGGGGQSLAGFAEQNANSLLNEWSLDDDSDEEVFAAADNSRGSISTGGGGAGAKGTKTGSAAGSGKSSAVGSSGKAGVSASVNRQSGAGKNSQGSSQQSQSKESSSKKKTSGSSSGKASSTSSNSDLSTGQSISSRKLR